MHYEVIEYSECMWVRRIGSETPIVYFEGTGQREEYLAYRAAMFLSRGLGFRNSGKSEHAVKQTQMVRELPGVKWYED